MAWNSGTRGLVYGGAIAIGAFAILVGCGSDDGASAGAAKSAAQRLCESMDGALARCGGGACDQALLADCTKLTAVLSDPFLVAAADCLDAGGSPVSCLGASVGALVPTEGQRQFIESFCAQCPPTPVPGCAETLLGTAASSGELSDLKKVILPLGDAVLRDIETTCFVGLTCLPSFTSCVQQVLAARALPQAAIECLGKSLVGTDASAAEAACPSDAGTGTGGAGADATGGSSGTENGAGGAGGSGAGGSGSGGSGSGGSSGTENGAGGAGGSGSGGDGSGGSGGSGATGAGGTTPACPLDAFEPNSSSASASIIDVGGDGQISKCEPPQKLDATIGGDDEGDWYGFFGLDGWCLSDAEPHASVTAPVPLDVCVYLRPEASATPICLVGTPATLAGGYYGCCGVDGARLEHSPPFASDAGEVLIHVAGTKVCSAYSLVYGYR